MSSLSHPGGSCHKTEQYQGRDAGVPSPNKQLQSIEHRSISYRCKSNTIFLLPCRYSLLTSHVNI
ncbi:hypothetical protein HKD37_13G036021 [Glycine soja]